MNICSKCKQTKPLTEFNKHKRGVHSWCKACVRERSREWYKEKNEIIKAKRKTYIQERKKWYDEYKQTLKCSKCGEDHPACLEFHHTNPKEKDFGISEAFGQLNLSKEEILKEINKCEVLCSNCHKKFHYEKLKTVR